MIHQIQRLREFYGLLPTPPADLFQFFLWEILSRDAIPARRDLAWLALKRIPALTPDAIARTKAGDLLDAIGQAGPYRDDRLDVMRAVVGEFKRHRDEMRDADDTSAGLRRAARPLKRLTPLDVSVRRRALLFAAGFMVMPVDDEIARVVNRLSGAEAIVPAGTERPHDRRRAQRAARRWLVDRLPRQIETYQATALYLRHHAQHTCIAFGPHCTVCPLREDCVAGRSVERGDAPP